MTENKLAVAQHKPKAIGDRLAESYGVDRTFLLDTIRTQVIRGEATNEQLMVVMSIMDSLKLSPFTKQMHAWISGGKFHVMIGNDGWIEFSRRDPRFSHMTYDESDELKELKGGKKCPEWIRPTIHLKDGTLVPFTRVMLDEWYLPNKEPWLNHPSHRLRMKAHNMAVREFCGMPLPDEVDREWIEISDEEPRERAERTTNESVATEADRLAAKMADIKAGQQSQAQQEAEDGEFDAVAPWEKDPEDTEPPDGTEAAEQQPGAGSSGDTPPPEAGLHGACYAPGCRNDAVGECSCGVAFCPQHSAGGDTCASCGSTGLF